MAKTLNEKLHFARGLCWHEMGVDRGKGFAVCVGCGGNFRYDRYHELPAYDSDLNAAFDLVEFMRSKWAKENPDETQFWKFTVSDCCEHGWRVDIEWGHHDGDIPIAHAVDEHLPRAIALAAIRALEAK